MLKILLDPTPRDAIRSEWDPSICFSKKFEVLLLLLLLLWLGALKHLTLYIKANLYLRILSSAVFLFSPISTSHSVTSSF